MVSGNLFNASLTVLTLANLKFSKQQREICTIKNKRFFREDEARYRRFPLQFAILTSNEIAIFLFVQWIAFSVNFIEEIFHPFKSAINYYII